MKLLYELISLSASSIHAVYHLLVGFMNKREQKRIHAACWYIPSFHACGMRSDVRYICTISVQYVQTRHAHAYDGLPDAIRLSCHFLASLMICLSLAGKPELICLGLLYIKKNWDDGLSSQEGLLWAR